MTKVPMCELTHAENTVFVQNPSVHTQTTIFFPSTSKNPKGANFCVHSKSLQIVRKQVSMLINHQISGNVSSKLIQFCWFLGLVRQFWEEGRSVS